MKEPDRSLSFKAAAAALRPRKMGADRPARGCAACLTHWRWGMDGGWGAGNNMAVKLLLSRKRILAKTRHDLDLVQRATHVEGEVGHFSG